MSLEQNNPEIRIKPEHIHDWVALFEILIKVDKRINSNLYKNNKQDFTE